MKHILFIATLLFTNILFAQTSIPLTYFCPKTEGKIIIDGKINDHAWEGCKWTADFIDIEGQKPAKLKTRVKILWDKHNLYFAALIEEPHIQASLTERESIIYFDNDFEIFIDPDKDNQMYYEFEINAFGTEWDLLLNKPYKTGGKPCFAWDIEGLQTAVHIDGSINNGKDIDNYWSVEIAMPWKSLIEYSSRKTIPEIGDIWKINFSRVEWDMTTSNHGYTFDTDKSGNRMPEHNWVWSPQGKINMHLPEMWGNLVFVNSVNDLPDNFNAEPDFHLKQKMYKLFEKEKHYYFHNKAFIDIKRALQFIPGYADISYEQTSKQFLISGKSRKGTWELNQNKQMIFTPIQKETPLFWTWSHAHPERTNERWDSVCKNLHKHGINGLLLSANEDVLKRVIPIAHSYGMQVHAWIWTMNRGDAPAEILSVNRNGKSLADEKAYVDYYKFMCPGLTETQIFLQDKFRNLLKVQNLDGIHFDYIRYVDVFLPEGLQPKYGIEQTEILPEYDYGYHPEMLKGFEQLHGYNPLDAPMHDSLWLEFRLNELTKTVHLIRDQIKASGIRCSAAVFPTPSMSAHMVRQPWDRWDLDLYFPMVYHNFYNEDSNWIKSCMEENATTVSQPMISGIYLPAIKNSTELRSCIEKAFEGGAHGVAFFESNGLTPEILETVKEFADSLVNN